MKRTPAPYATPTYVTLMMMRNGADPELIAAYMAEEIRRGGLKAFEELLTPEERLREGLALGFQTVRDGFAQLAFAVERAGNALSFLIRDETAEYRRA